MKRTDTARAIALAVLMITSVFAVAIPAATPVAAQPANDTLPVRDYQLEVTDGNEATAEWSGTGATDGSEAVHLLASDTDASLGDEARITIPASAVGVTTLSDLDNVSWTVRSGAGYAPHLDVIVEKPGGGEDSLVFEYAKVDPAQCDNSGSFPTGDFGTFADKGVVDENAYAWLGSGPPGPCGDAAFDANHMSLSDWQTGTSNPEGINGSTEVLRLELEVDNWVNDPSEAYVDQITVNGQTYYGTIQDAEDSASPGDHISVGPGDYAGFLVNERVTIEGENRSTVVVDAELGTGSSGRTIDIRDSSGDPDESTIKNLTIDATHPDSTYRTGVSVSADNVTLRHLTVLGDDEVTGIQTNTGYDGPGSEGTVIDENTVRDANVGVSLQGGPDTATDNLIENPILEGFGLIAGTDHEGSGNVVENPTGPGVRFYGGTITNAELAALFDANPGIHTVDNGTGTTLRNVVAGGDYYPSINAAIHGAGDGGTVEVRHGQWTQDVTVDRDVTLVGEDEPVINAHIQVVVDGPTLADFVVDDPGDSGEVEGIFIGNPSGYVDDPSKVITVSDVTIRNVEPESSTKTAEGIHIKSYDDEAGTPGDQTDDTPIPIDGVVIENTTIRNVSQPAAGGTGIKIQASVTNVTVRDSTIEAIHGDWSYGVVATPSNAEIGTPSLVRIIDNDFDSITAVTYNGAAVGVDGSAGNGFVDGRQLFVRDNSFTGMDYGVLNKDDEFVDARYNWWGSKAGPGNSPDVFGNVTVAPWLLSENYVPPSADAGPDKVRTGTGDVTLDAGLSTVGTSSATYQWTVDGTTKSGKKVTFRLSPGSYTAVLTVDDGREISKGDSAKITVKKPPEQDRGSGERQAPTQSVTRSDSGTTFKKTIADDDPTSPGTDVTFSPEEVDGETQSPPVDRITFDKAFGGGEISVEPADPPSPADVGEDSDAVIRSFSVTASPIAENTPATIRFSISRDELDGRSPSDVRLARQTEDGWELFDAEPVDVNADPIEFRSRVPGFSNWAVVLQRSQAQATATPVPTTTAAEQPEQTPTPETTEMDVTPEQDDDETARPDTGPEQTQSPGLDGFGIAIAIVALLSIALLATRRKQ